MDIQVRSQRQETRNKKQEKNLTSYLLPLFSLLTLCLILSISIGKKSAAAERVKVAILSLIHI